MNNNSQNLVKELQELIVSVLNLEDVEPQSIDPNAPLFGAGLGLDSIDALEIGAAIRKKYGVKLRSQSEENREHFQSVNSMVRFIESASE